MEEYIDSGAEMGLLIDRIKRQVHVYRCGRKAKVLDEPETVSCDPALPGFSLDMDVRLVVGGTAQRADVDASAVKR